MGKNLFDKRQRFSIRKLSVGAASVMVGAFVVGAGNSSVAADEVTANEAKAVEASNAEVKAEQAAEAPVAAKAEATYAAPSEQATKVDASAYAAPATEVKAEAAPKAEEAKTEEKAVEAPKAGEKKAEVASNESKAQTKAEKRAQAFPKQGQAMPTGTSLRADLAAGSEKTEEEKKEEAISQSGDVTAKNVVDPKVNDNITSLLTNQARDGKTVRPAEDITAIDVEKIKTDNTANKYTFGLYNIGKGGDASQYKMLTETNKWYVRLSKERNNSLTVTAELVEKDTQKVLEKQVVAVGEHKTFDTFSKVTGGELVYHISNIDKGENGATVLLRALEAKELTKWDGSLYSSESFYHDDILEVTNPTREGTYAKAPAINVPRLVDVMTKYKEVDEANYDKSKKDSYVVNGKETPITATATDGTDVKGGEVKAKALEGQQYDDEGDKEFKDYEFVKSVVTKPSIVIGKYKVGAKYVDGFLPLNGQNLDKVSNALVYEITKEDGSAKLSVYQLDPTKASQALTSSDADAIVNSSAYVKIFETYELAPTKVEEKNQKSNKYVVDSQTVKTGSIGNYHYKFTLTTDSRIQMKWIRDLNNLDDTYEPEVNGIGFGGRNHRLLNSNLQPTEAVYYYAKSDDTTPPKPTPKKDVVKEVNENTGVSGLSVDGGTEEAPVTHAEGHNSITYNGETVFFKINGSKLVAGSGYTYTTDLVYTDTLDSKVEYVSVLKSLASAEFTKKDGTKIAKGTDISEYVTSKYDKATHTVTITVSQKLLDQIDPTTGFQYVGYIKATAKDFGKIENTYVETVNDFKETSNKVTVEVPKPTPEKHNYLEEAHTTVIDGKETARTQVNYYNAKWDKTPFKGMLITSESAKTIQAYIDDYDESVVTPLTEKFKYTDAAGKEVNGLKLFHVLSGQAQNDLVKKVLGMYAEKGFTPKGNFLLWVVGADDAGNVDEAVVRDHVNTYNAKGTDIFLSLPMENKADAPTKQTYFNTVHQIDFSSAALGNTVDNIIPEPKKPNPDPKKDVVKNIGDVSVNGEVKHAEGHNSITYNGETVFFKINGSELKAGKGYTYDQDLVYKDVLDEKVKYVGVEESKAAADFTLLKDSEVAKALGKTTIAKGDSIAKYVTTAYDEAKREVTITVKKELLNSIDPEKGFQYVGYIKATAIKEGKIANTFDEYVNNVKQTSNKVTVEVPTPKPEKHNYSDTDHKNNIDGKETLRGQVNHYLARWDKAPFKGMHITSDAAKTLQAFIDDYDESVVTPLVDQFKYKDAEGKEVNGLQLFHVLAGQEQNALVKKVLGMYAEKGYAPKGDFLLWVVGADASGAEDKVDADVVSKHITTYNKGGIDIYFDLPMQNKVDAPIDYRYTNSVAQVDFSTAAIGNVVDNVIYKPQPKKDITKVVAGESIDGSQAKIGDEVFFKVIGSVFKKDRGYTFTEDLIYVDALDKKVDYVGVEESKAPFDITLEDGTVIKKGDSISKYVTVGYDKESHTVYIAISKDFLNSISLESDYQYLGYIKTRANAPGTVENVIDEYINGVKGRTNKVTIHIPPVPPTTPNKPKEPTPPSPERRKELPQTGETSSTAAIALAVTAAVGAMGLAASRKKED